MSRIVFLCDLEEGHLLPTFGLAQSLKARGHEIIYLSVADNEELIRRQDFTFYPVLEEFYPKGFRESIKQSRLEKTMTSPYQYKHAEAIIKGAYDRYVHELKADLYMVNVVLAFDTMVLFYRYNIKAVTLTGFRNRVGKSVASDCLGFINSLTLPEKCSLLELLTNRGKEFNSFHEVVEPITSLHELRLWPSELEINPEPEDSNVHYTEPSIRKKESSINVYEEYNIPPSRKIVYASLGSQMLRHATAYDHFFKKLISIMRSEECRNLHLILCVAKEYDTSALEPIPDNVTLLVWAPQLNILQVASAAVIHGGLGSLKECIYFGVPMIIFPQGYDQPSNARSAMHYNLGFTDNITTVSEEKLKEYILKLLTDSGIRSSIAKMQQIFQEKEDRKIGAEIVEEIIEMQQEEKCLQLN